MLLYIKKNLRLRNKVVQTTFSSRKISTSGLPLPSENFVINIRTSGSLSNSEI